MVNQMTKNPADIREQISALADGQLDGVAVDDTLLRLGADTALQAEWNAYHVVGEALRAGERSMLGADPAFVGRLRDRLQAEPARPAVMAVVPPQVKVDASAANEPVFRWKLVAGFASLAAVAALGWSLVGGLPSSSGASGPVLASAPADATAPGAVATSAGTMIRDPRLDELLAAHKEAGGVSALQMPAGFLRNATFEGPQR